MSDQSNSTEDYTPEQKAWSQVQHVVDDLTRQRDKLAKSYRKFEADQADGIDPLRELQSVHDAIRKSMPDLVRVAPEHGPADMSAGDLLDDYWEQVKKRKNTVTTGIAGLNDVLSGGFEPGRLVCALGAPNTGKTTLIHQIAEHIASTGRPVLYVSSEDTPSALVAKTLSRVGKVNYNAVLKGWESEKDKINTAIATLRDLPSKDRLRYLDAIDGVTLDIIREKAAEHFAKFSDENGGGPGVIVVDYLQRIARAIKTMSGMTQDLREVVTMVSERLRSLARELDCTVIAITAQNRTGYTRSSDGNSLASAKESGDIEYTCDVMLALIEDKDKNRVPPPGRTAVLLYVDKNRQGEKNRSVPLDFWGMCQEFTEAEL
jgi:replicative DNA helicase